MHAEVSSRRRDALVPAGSSDLPAELESLFHTVWQCEKDWRLDDRIDLALRREEAARTAQNRGGR